jgi:hypothetical protein
MNKWTRPFGLVIFLTWLSNVYMIFPLPTEQIEILEDAMISETLSKPDIEAEPIKHNSKSKEIWLNWILSTSLIIAGIASGFLVFINRIGLYPILVTSILYLSSWFFTILPQHFPEHATAFHTYFYVKGFLFERSDYLTKAFIIHNDFLVPAIHLLAVIMCFIFLYLKFKTKKG